MDAVTKFWKEVESLLINNQQPIFYRLYYDEKTGSPLFYSMEDLEGTYVEIDHETYAKADGKVRVVDGKVKQIKQVLTNKLVPSLEGTKCLAGDITIIANNNKTSNIDFWNKKFYDHEN